jgi:hypothetical protein
MTSTPTSAKPERSLVVALCLVTALALGVLAWHWRLEGRARGAFPEGYDAVQAAPASHRVLFENGFVRVLEVDVAPGATVPWHHHRWPGLWVGWDQGGRTGHFRYHGSDGTLRDIPSTDAPLHGGKWAFHWVGPEPMHSVENLDTAEEASRSPKGPGGLRIEFKVSP